MVINCRALMATYHRKHLFDVLIYQSNHVTSLVNCCVAAASDKPLTIIELAANNEA